MATAGAAGSALLAIFSGRTSVIQASETIVLGTTQSTSPEQRLRELGIELPPAPRPVGVYVPAVRTGNILFTAGHTPRAPDGSPQVVGKVGVDLTVEEAHAAARICGLNLLSTVRQTLGSLDNVVQLVKVLGMVNCAPDFGQQPQVINGFSELLVEVFGEEIGRGGRAAVGMASLPANQPVEVEAIFEVRG
jgi:enamine deaminase RidA (YjgF/YER057c/UK114 family)